MDEALNSEQDLSSTPLRIVAVAALLAAQPAVALEQRDVGTGRLPPITSSYPARIVSWGAAFYADPNALLGASLSAPVLIRDGTGRLVWLVCLDTPNAPPDLRFGGVQRQAFGFAPGYFSAPQERRRATLTRDYCDEQPLVWRPLRTTVRSARRH